MLAFLRFNVVTQMRKERPKEAPTYQTPRNDHRARTEPALLGTSLKWPPLSTPFRGLLTDGQGGSASWPLYPGQLAQTGQAQLPGVAGLLPWQHQQKGPALEEGRAMGLEPGPSQQTVGTVADTPAEPGIREA